MEKCYDILTEAWSDINQRKIIKVISTEQESPELNKLIDAFYDYKFPHIQYGDLHILESVIQKRQPSCEFLIKLADHHRYLLDRLVPLLNTVPDQLMIHTLKRYMGHHLIQKASYTSEILELVCQNPENLLNIHIDYIDRYIINRGKLTQAMLYSRIAAGDLDVVNILLDNGVPTNDHCVKLIVKTDLNRNRSNGYPQTSCDNVIKILERLLIPHNIPLTPDIFNHFDYNVSYNDIGARVWSKEYAHMAELLIAYGIHPTYEHLLQWLSCGMYFNDIQRFGFILDDKYNQIAMKRKFFPYKHTPKFTIADLNNACMQRGNLSVIKLIINSGIMPTQQMFDNACKVQSNTTTVRYLMKYGFHITSNNLYEWIENNHTTSMLRFLMTETRKDEMYEKESEEESEKESEEESDE